MNVVVIAPHPDDDAIGCGGTICLHADRGDRVTVVFLTSGERGLSQCGDDAARAIREKEAAASAEVLQLADMTFLRYPDLHLRDVVEGAARDLRPILEREAPQIVYLPHPGESHPDHAAALSVARGALGSADRWAPTLLTYEVWTPLPDCYHVENITAVMLRKLRAVRCHRSQVGQLRYDRAVMGLNLYRGAVNGGCRYAEIFQTSDIYPDAQTL